MTDLLLLAQEGIDNDADVSGWIWVIVGVLAIIALAIWILRNLR